MQMQLRQLQLGVWKQALALSCRLHLWALLLTRGPAWVLLLLLLLWQQLWRWIKCKMKYRATCSNPSTSTSSSSSRQLVLT
jgi:hypothetical protein